MSKAALLETLPPDIGILYDRELVRREGLRGFARIAWHIVEPAYPLKWNWHHDAICEHVEAVLAQELQELVICVPPGMTKSMIVSVLASAYAWTYNPAYRIMNIAYADKLSRRDSRKVRMLVKSRWFQERWPMPLVKESETRLENVSTGFRIPGSVRSGVIGERANLLLIDDPLSRETAESPAERKRTSEFVWETLPSRMTDFDKDGKILIMQRLHGADTAAEAKDRGWEMLVLPNEFEEATRCRTSLGFVDPRTKEGELLHPARLSQKATDKMKGPNGIGNTAYAGQYQQRPAPREGNLVKYSWFENRWFVKGERPLRVLQSWDCASKPAERNDPSACLTAAEFDDRVELWDYWCKRVEFPELWQALQDRFSGQTSPGVFKVLIEDKDAGQQLIQTAKRSKTTKIPVEACQPGSLDKVTRLSASTPLMENKRVWLPASAPWVAPFLDELTTIPGAPHDESGDTLSQLLNWIRDNPFRRGGGGIVVVGKESGRLDNG